MQTEYDQDQGHALVGQMRQIMLDIGIDFVNQRTGGSTKYINQRDRDFIRAFLQEENYRREFTDALRDYVSMGNSKSSSSSVSLYSRVSCERAFASSSCFPFCFFFWTVITSSAEGSPTAKFTSLIKIKTHSC